VVNLLARAEPDLLDQLLVLGPALAEAQRDGQGDVLRQLGQQRRELVGAVTATAVGLAGRAVASAVRAEVEQTLEAALADPLPPRPSGRAAWSARSPTPVSATSTCRAPWPQARPAAGPIPGPQATTTREPQALAAAESRALDAAAALDDAVRACERLAATAEQAGELRQRAQDDARTAAQERERI
jgi:hypothetical protein